MVLNLGVTLSGAIGHKNNEQSHEKEALEAGAGKESTSERSNLFELLVLGLSVWRPCAQAGGEDSASVTGEPRVRPKTQRYIENMV